MFSEKNLKTITQILLVSVIVIVPFLKVNSLYFPYISGKVYIFRLLVALAFFFWVWLMLKEKEYPSTSLGASKPNFKNILILAVFLFFLAQVLVSFFGVDPTLSFFSTIERGDGTLQYGFLGLYFLMLLSVLKKEQDWKSFFSAFIVVAFLLSVYSWLNYTSQVRLYAIFGNSSYFAAFLLFAIGFSVIIIERKFFHQKYLNYSILAGILFFIITLIATQTRGAYAGLAGGIFLFCLLATLFLRKENKKLALSCGIILLLGLISITVLFIAKDTDFVQNTYILKRTASVANLLEDDVVRERILTWQIALKAFQEKPIFGWGPENFGSAFNKYYDYRIGIAQPWFDRAHNYPLEILATGGAVLFSFYLFLLAAIIYIASKIARRKKILSFILLSILLAYFLQGLFLFDTLPTYLGLFPFLAFLVFSVSVPITSGTTAGKQETNQEKEVPKDFTRGRPRYKIQDTSYKILIPAALFSSFIIYATCFVPYKANALALKFLAFTESGIHREAKSFLEQSYNIKSPYTFWEVRKRTGWQLVIVLEHNLNEATTPENINALSEIYDYITPELERFVEEKPYDPQMYFILGRIYYFGFEKLGKNDLDKAEKVLKKGFNYSDRRAEYFNELAKVLILEGKFEESEKLVKEHIKRVSFDIYFPYITLGHFYFTAERYDLAWEQYETAREMGYEFYGNDIDYPRYMAVAEWVGDYQKVVDIAGSYLEKWGPNADTYYNIAVGYLNLGETEKAKEFFLKAVELKKEYEEYRPFFAP